MHKFLLYSCILLSILFLLIGKSYSPEQLIAANFLSQNGIIHDWSRIPPRYKFNDDILLVDALNISLSLNGIQKNIHCRGDYAKRLSPYDPELCRTFESAEDAGIFDSQSDQISPLQLLSYEDFFAITGIGNSTDKYLIYPDRKIKRGEAFVLLYSFLSKKSHGNK